MVQKNFRKPKSYLNSRGRVVNVVSIGKKTAMTSTGKLVSAKRLRRI